MGPQEALGAVTGQGVPGGKAQPGYRGEWEQNRGAPWTLGASGGVVSLWVRAVLQPGLLSITV